MARIACRNKPVDPANSYPMIARLVLSKEPAIKTQQHTSDGGIV